MGGTAAVPAQVDDRLRQLGIEPVRLAGDGREATAAAASQAVEQLKADATFETRDYAFVVNGRVFADAVTAGQMAAYYGIPVLVTNLEGPLHPATRAELQRLAPEQVYVVGGTAAVSEPVVDDIRELGLPVDRLAGPTRVDTGLAVFDAYVDELRQDGALDGARTVAVNVRNNFNDVLSATLLGGRGNVFMPLEEDAGASVITVTVEAAFCRFGTDLVVIGGRDRVTTESAVRAHEILQGDGC
jgi:putative cell wall-binding protein